MTDNKCFRILLYILLFSGKKVVRSDLERVPAMPQRRLPVVREDIFVDAMYLPLDVDPVILTSVAYFDLGNLRPLISQLYDNCRDRKLNAPNFNSIQTSLAMLLIQWHRDQTTQPKDIERLMKLYDISLPTPEGSNLQPNYAFVQSKVPSCTGAWDHNITSNYLRGKTRLSEINDVMEILPTFACVSAHILKIIIKKVTLDKRKRQCEMNLIRRIDIFINSEHPQKDEQLTESILQMTMEISFLFEEKALAKKDYFIWDEYNKIWLQEAIQYPGLINPVVLGNLKILPIQAKHQILSFYDRCFENGYYPNNFEQWDELLARAIKEWKKDNTAIHKLFVVINWVMLLNSRWVHSEEQKTQLTSPSYHQLIREGYNPQYVGKKEFQPNDLAGKSKLSDIKNVIDSLPPDVSLQLTMIEIWARRNDKIAPIEEDIIKGIQQFLHAHGTLHNLRSVVREAFDSVLEVYAQAVTEKSMEAEDDSKRAPDLVQFQLFGKQISFSRIERQIDNIGKEDDSAKSDELKLFGRQISLTRIEKLSVVQIAIDGFPYHADINWTSTWEYFLNVMDLPTKAHPIVIDSLLILPMTVRKMILEAYYTCYDSFATEHEFKFMEKTLISMILEWRSSFFHSSKKEAMLQTASNLQDLCSADMANKEPGVFTPVYRPISDSVLCDNDELGKFDASIMVGKTSLQAIKPVIMALPADNCVRVIIMRCILARMPVKGPEYAAIEKSALEAIEEYLGEKDSNKLAVNLANLSFSLFEVFEKLYYRESTSSLEHETATLMNQLLDFKSETAVYNEEKPHDFMYPSVLRIKRHLTAEFQEKLQILYGCLADEVKFDRITQDRIQTSLLGVMLNFIETSAPKVLETFLNRSIQQLCYGAEPSRKRLKSKQERTSIPSGKKQKLE